MQKRSLVKMALLTIVTLGIYQIFWLYSTRQELLDKGYKIPSLFVLVGPYLVLVTMVLLSFALNMDWSFAPVSEQNPITAISMTIAVIAYLAVVPVAIYWFYKYCKAVELVTDGAFPFDMSFLSFILFSLFGLWFVWAFFVQYYYNLTTQSTVRSIRI